MADTTIWKVQPDGDAERLTCPVCGGLNEQKSTSCGDCGETFNAPSTDPDDDEPDSGALVLGGLLYHPAVFFLMFVFAPLIYLDDSLLAPALFVVMVLIPVGLTISLFASREAQARFHIAARIAFGVLTIVPGVVLMIGLMVLLQLPSC